MQVAFQVCDQVGARLRNVMKQIRDVIEDQVKFDIQSEIRISSLINPKIHCLVQDRVWEQVNPISQPVWEYMGSDWWIT